MKKVSKKKVSKKKVGAKKKTFTKEQISDAIESCGQNMSDIARCLGISWEIAKREVEKHPDLHNKFNEAGRVQAMQCLSLLGNIFKIDAIKEDKKGKFKVVDKDVLREQAKNARWFLMVSKEGRKIGFGVKNYLSIEDENKNLDERTYKQIRNFTDGITKLVGPTKKKKRKKK